MNSFGIIFDCDGTLVDSMEKAMESFLHALQQVGEGQHTPEDVKRFFGSGADRIFMGLLRDTHKAALAFEHYLDHQTELAKTTKLHEGVRELLNALEEQRVPLGVVTGRHARDLEIVLRPHEIAARFRVMVADSHVQRSKPAPDGILLAASKLNLAADRVVYVGDSVMDVQAAQSAGAKSIAAMWDLGVKREEMARAKPSFVADRPDQIIEFLAQMF